MSRERFQEIVRGGGRRRSATQRRHGRARPHPRGRRLGRAEGLARLARTGPARAAWAAATTSSSCSTTASGCGSCSTPARAASGTASPPATSSALGGAGPVAGPDGPRLLHARRRARGRSYRNAVAAGGNYAIVNRLLIGRVVSGAFRGGLRRRGRARLRDQPQPGPGGAPSGPVRPSRSGSTARARPRALPAGHPMLAGTRWAGDGPSGAHPGLHGRLLVRAAPAAGRRTERCTPSTTGAAGASRAPPRGARSARPRPTARCASWASW